MSKSNLGKGFVSKRVNLNGSIVDMSIPIKSLDEWKDLIVE